MLEGDLLSRRYTPEEKSAALQRLDDNFGDVAVTSIQTGVPTRTLREWKRQRHLEAFQTGQLPPQNQRRQQRQQQIIDPTNNDDDDDDDEGNKYRRLRKELMQHIFDLSATLMDDPQTAYLRAVTLSRLIDRVIRLEAIIPQTDKERRIIVEYRQPDGSLKPHSPYRSGYRPDGDS